MSDEFTIGHYGDMLGALRRAGYETVSYSTAARGGDADRKLLLRHDVDFSLDHLATIGEVDNEHGFMATFFIQSRSPLYNPFSIDAKGVLERLGHLGHRVGLHHDPVAGTHLAAVKSDVELMERAGLLTETSTVSLHRPGIMSTLLTDLEYAPRLHHTHEGEFAKFAYFSDSACHRRDGPPHRSEAFAQGRPLQVLTHPLWWLVDGVDGAEKLRNFAADAANRTLDQLRRTAVSFRC